MILCQHLKYFGYLYFAPFIFSSATSDWPPLNKIIPWLTVGDSVFWVLLSATHSILCVCCMFSDSPQNYPNVTYFRSFKDCWNKSVWELPDIMGQYIPFLILWLQATEIWKSSRGIYTQTVEIILPLYHTLSLYTQWSQLDRTCLAHFFTNIYQPHAVVISTTITCHFVMMYQSTGCGIVKEKKLHVLCQVLCLYFMQNDTH